MKKWWVIFLVMFCFLVINTNAIFAQCSICTKTAQQLGEGPAKSLNAGIVYLMFSPLIIIAVIGYRWWKKEREVMQEEGNPLL